MKRKRLLTRKKAIRNLLDWSWRVHGFAKRWGMKRV
jgi:hypothetical protein